MDIDLREENASNQSHRASLLIPSEAGKARGEHYGHGSLSAAVLHISLIAYGNVAYEFARGSALMLSDLDVEAQVRGRWLTRRWSDSS